MYRPFDEFRPEGSLISVIGSGGKTTFLRWLSERLPGSVVLTTSTHIWPFPEIPLMNATPENREQVLSELRAALARSRVVCLGSPEPSGKLADPSPVVPFETLLEEADQASFPEGWKNVLALGCPVMLAGLLILWIIERFRRHSYRIPGEGKQPAGRNREALEKLSELPVENSEEKKA